MNRPLDFSPTTVQALFGHEAAENEDPKRLQEYYFKTATYENVVTDLPVRILVGHKGIGKSALFQVAMAEERAANRIALLVKPDDIAELQEEGQDFLKAIRTWKNGLSDILASKTLKSLGLKSDTWQDRLKDFGGRLLDFLRQTLKSTEQYSLEPSNRLLVETFLKTNEISVYIDDLDRGWQGRQPVVHNISALLNAARDLSTENPGIRFRISLRSDVYFLIRTSDESTDKIEGSVVWQSYDLHEIFCLLVKRIETFFGRDLDYDGLRYRSQSDLSQYLDPVMDPRFYGHGKWSDVATYRVLLTLDSQAPARSREAMHLGGQRCSLGRSQQNRHEASAGDP